MTNPKYNFGDVVYLKESAALGFLEAMRISGVHLGQSGWMYTVDVSQRQPQAASFYGDRRSFVHHTKLYFTEDEFVVLCDALLLAETNAQLTLDRLRAQRAALCPSGSN